MNWCSPKWMATIVGCFAGGTTLFVVGAYFSYVNIEPQRARTLARDQLLKDYLRKKYGYGITRSSPLQVSRKGRHCLLIWGHRLSAVSGDRSLAVMNWCSPKWMATTVGCFAGGTALFVVGAYFSYVNIEPQRARTLARDQLLKDYLRKKYGYGITRSPPLQVLPVPGFPLISTLSPAPSPPTPPPSSTTPLVPSG